LNSKRYSIFATYKIQNVVLDHTDEVGATGYDGRFAASENGFSLRQGFAVRSYD
jgi:hypothetical protein